MYSIVICCIANSRSHTRRWLATASFIHWNCSTLSATVTVFPPARLELPATAPNSASGDVLPPALQRFHAWCAACHLSAEQFPPNFLHGPSAGLEGRITQCAPRIFVRLAMADRPAERREKTPMPPEALLPAFGSHAAAWAASPERKALLDVVATRLKARTGRDPDVDSLLAAGYEALPPCLAPGQ